jgi:hypothetical protein
MSLVVGPWPARWTCAQDLATMPILELLEEFE